MANSSSFFVKALERKLDDEWGAIPETLKARYDYEAKPSYVDNISSRENESEFLGFEKRYEASHITKGFLSKDEFKDDLKALIIKPKILVFEGLTSGFEVFLNLWVLLAHMVSALVELVAQKPEQPETGLWAKTKSFFGGKSSAALELPREDLKNAMEAAVDVLVSLVKSIVYPTLALFELGAQITSFALKCFFSLNSENQLGARVDGWLKAGEGALTQAQIYVQEQQNCSM